MSEKQEWIKIILLGESGVGKTNLINTITGKGFDSNSRSSLTSSYSKKVIKIDNKDYTYILWDTAGQENYRSLNKIFIKNSKIVIFVFSIESKRSFEELEYWIETTQNELESGEYIAGIAGNKIDLVDKQQVEEEEAKNYAQKHNMKFRPTSALADPNGFQSFVDELIHDYLKINGLVINKDNDKIVIKQDDIKKKKKCCK